MNQDIFINNTRRWVESVVIDLNLCPFAKREMINNRVRFTITEADTEAQLLFDLHCEITLLSNDADIETTLLIHPQVLQEFSEYNEFLALADDLLVETNLEGVFQIAGFHPDYQFADTSADDVENFTNRSPYPMLHILRETSLERAIADHPDISGIPKRNIQLMRDMGSEKMKQLLQATLGK
jgi:hypothetical protein